jgi:MFS family permease
MHMFSVSTTFRALRYRNYRLFFIGQSISLTGTWMQQVAISWLTYRLTGSALLLGIISFAGQLPAFLLLPFAGVIADRFDKRRVLLMTQALSMLQALILAFLVITQLVAIWQIILLSVFLGIVNSFDMPARQAFVIHMVDRKEDVSNAIALNSTMFNGARLIGPTIAGMLIAMLGEGMCFLLNGLSYAAVIISLYLLSVNGFVPDTKDIRKPLADLLAGTRYTFGFVPIRVLILLLGLISLAGMPAFVLMPVFAKTILNGGPHTLGMLTGASGLGALAGALYLASRTSILGLGRVIAAASAVFGAAICLFSLSGNLYISLSVLVFVGFSMIVQLAASNTILQTIADDAMRGRVMAFYAMAFAGMAPIGSLIAGFAAERFGTPAVVFTGGLLCLAGAALFCAYLPSLRALLRPVYIQKGILPEIALGIQTADTLASIQKE